MPRGAWRLALLAAAGLSLAVAGPGGASDGAFGSVSAGHTETDVLHRDAAAVAVVVHRGRSEQAQRLRSWVQSWREELEGGTQGGAGARVDAIGVNEKKWVRDGIICWAIWLFLAQLVFSYVYVRKVPDTVPSSEASPQKTFRYGHLDCLSDMETCVCACLCPALRWSDTVDRAGFLQFNRAFWLFVFLGLLNLLMNVYSVLCCGLLVFLVLIYYGREVHARVVSDTQHWPKGLAAIMLAFLLLGAICFWIVFGEVLGPLAIKYEHFVGCFTFGFFTTFAMLWYRQRLRAMLNQPYGTCESYLADCCFLFWCPHCAIAQEARILNELYELGNPSVKGGPLTPMAFPAAPPEEDAENPSAAGSGGGGGGGSSSYGAIEV